MFMWLISVLLLLAYWFLVATKHPKGFPPGPRMSLPVIGNAFDIGTNIGKGFQRLTSKYGKVFGLYFGKDRAVVVSDFKLIQDIGNSEVFTDRQDTTGIADMRGGRLKSGSVPGIVMSNGETRVEQRRFVLRTLKDLGFGKQGMEQHIIEEVNDLCKILKDLQGKPVEIKETLNFAVLNSLWTLVSGERLDHKDKKLNKLMNLMHNVMKQMGNLAVRIAMAYNLTYSLTKNNYLKTVCKATQDVFDFINEMVEQHEQTYQEENLRDFTDHYLKEIKDKSAQPGDSSFKGHDGKLSLLNVLFDFFAAGSETTSSSVSWCMLYMILHPDIQTRVQDELDKVTGRSRLPNMDDRDNTPFTMAVIEEVQRLSNVAPTSITHVASSDARIGDYFVPKGTVLLQHLRHVHKDPEHFPNPVVFDPTRHLSNEGKFVPSSKMIPFGYGKRRCPGEPLARMSLYLFMTGILSNFTLVKAHENDYLSTEPCPGSTQAPYPFKIRFMPRS